MNETYLAHYGVKGMKWGIRRYQNADGTLNDAGKKRYNRITQHEDVARVVTSGADHRKKVMQKYESKKNDSQKQADATRQKAIDDYYKYVDDYRKTHTDTQVRYEHDYDHTEKGKQLLKAIADSSEVRELAYVGAEWYAKYAKDMERAANKDYMRR